MDADGVTEIVADSRDRWYVLSLQAGEYVPEWGSFRHPSAIQVLRVAQLDADPALEVILVLDTEIRVYDGASHVRERTFRTGIENILVLEAGDVDADGRPELVLSSWDGFFVLDATTGAVEIQHSAFIANGLAFAQIDADPALEIVVGIRYQPGWVVDGATGAVQWDNEDGFGDYVGAADLDGDGVDEIVASHRDAITVYEADTQSVRYTVPVQDLGVVHAADVDGDAIAEVIWAPRRGWDVHVLDGATGAELWSVPNRDGSVTNFAVGEIDGDGSLEILWGGAFHSTAPDHLNVVDSGTHLLEWQSAALNGAMYGLDHGDVDADGAPEILSTTLDSEGGFEDGLYFVHNAVSHTLGSKVRPDGDRHNGSWRVRADDLDADPQLEIVFTAADGILIAYDGVSHAEEWRTEPIEALDYRSLEIADVDDDTRLEVVAGTGRLNTGASGVHLYVYDAATGT